ncbi:unnamed protein product [Porites evermanni]|uniref:Uncharacterized protein n=1 Tax=Porites evermanni TaxID=104178 RepID=A0ABN8ST32_9CNID|nr:unnamed protein product [Porites evermanni]
MAPYNGALVLLTSNESTNSFFWAQTCPMEIKTGVKTLRSQGNQLRYPVDSAIHFFNNWDQGWALLEAENPSYLEIFWKFPYPSQVGYQIICKIKGRTSKVTAGDGSVPFVVLHIPGIKSFFLTF